MARPNYGVGNWPVNGPRALAWLRAEAPKRSTATGLPADCALALGLPVDGRRLTDWLGESAREEWKAIKRSLGTGSQASASSAPQRTLEQYLLDKRKADCPVCHLSPEVRDILKRASEKGSARVAEQLDWLRDCCGVTVTARELTTHRVGGHEA